MEMFCMPLEEVRDKFTLSEVVLMGWRSQEQVHNMKRKMKKRDEDGYEDQYESEEETTERPKKGKSKKGRRVRHKAYDGHVPDGLPDRFWDEEGEVNLSKVGIKDALKYLNGMGFKFPMKVVR